MVASGVRGAETMILHLENESLNITVDSKGAELQSLFWKEENLELLWEGDPAFWPRHAPVLFPIVGKLQGDRSRVEGHEVRLAQHGFARDSEFAVLEKGPACLRFLLHESPETMERFPFPFELELDYCLEGNSLRVGHTVRNTGTGLLPFCLGAHPGFCCPSRPGERFEDYVLKFEVPETLGRHLLHNGLLSPEPEPLLENLDTLPLSYGLFERDAIVLKGVRSSWVELRPRRRDGPTRGPGRLAIPRPLD